MKIAIIPARSGSKRIKNKNIKNFLGKPIISYTIKKLKESGLFKKIYVSTNCQKIAKISKKYGAEVPFIRDNRLAGDNISTIDVISNFLTSSLIAKMKIELVCCVYPCTPLLQISDIKKGIRLFFKKKSSFVYPVLKYKHPIQRSFTMSKLGKIKYFFPKYETYRTQDLKIHFHDAGQFYISSPHNWKNKKKLHIDSICFETKNFNAIDIDDLDDWKMAELIFKNGNKY